MTLEVTDFVVIIGVTSGITTATTSLIVLKATSHLKETFCNQINDLLVRVGILEKKPETT